MDNKKIDNLVAEKVMGWRWFHTTCRKSAIHRLRIKEGASYIEKKVPAYSSDVVAAWDIMEKLKENFHPSIAECNKKWVVCMWPDKQTEAVGESESMALAICLAALKAKGVNYEV